MSIEILEIIALAIALLLFGVLYKLDKKGIDFGIRTILALAFGLLLGSFFRGSVTYVAVVGKIYVNLIYAIVVPLLVVSIISSVAALGTGARLKSIGVKSVGWLTSNTFIASLLTLPIAFLFRVGKGVEVSLPTDYVPREVPGIAQVIIDLFPKNIISDAADGNIIPIIITSLLIGIAVLSIGEKDNAAVKPFLDFIQATGKIVFWIVDKVISLTPYAVLALISNATSNNGPEKLAPLLYVLLAAYVACIIQTFIVGGTLIRLFAGLNPITFFKKIWPAQMVAFTSQSSAGTLPVTLKCLVDDVGVSPNIANFTAPLGSSVGMPGCAGIWPTLLAVFAIQGLGLSYTPFQYAFLIFLTVIVSLGTAGVPGTATITATAVFAAAGLPVEVIVLLTPISSIVDMARTATNVSAAAVSATIVAKREGELDEALFKKVKPRVLGAVNKNAG